MVFFRGGVVAVDYCLVCFLFGGSLSCWFGCWRFAALFLSMWVNLVSVFWVAGISILLLLLVSVKRILSAVLLLSGSDFRFLVENEEL